MCELCESSHGCSCECAEDDLDQTCDCDDYETCDHLRKCHGCYHPVRRD